MNKRINQISFGDLFSTSTVSQASYENRFKKHPSDLCLESSSQGGTQMPYSQMDTFDSQNSQFMSSQQQLSVVSSQKTVRKSPSDDGNRETYKGYSSFNPAAQQPSSLRTLGQPQQLSLCRARIEEVEERETMDAILSHMKNYSSEIKEIGIDFNDKLERANVLSNNMISKYSENVKDILDNQFNELSTLLKIPSNHESNKDAKIFVKFDELKNVLEKQSSSLGKLTKIMEGQHKQTTNSIKSMKKEVDESLCQYAAELTGILKTFITRIEDKLSTKADDIMNCLCDKLSSNVSSQSKSVSDMEVQVDSMASSMESNTENENLIPDKMDSGSADVETVPTTPQEESFALCLTPNKHLNGSASQLMIPYNDSAFYSEVMSTDIIQDHEFHYPVINLSTKNARPVDDNDHSSITNFATTPCSSSYVQTATPLDLSMQKLSLDGCSDVPAMFTSNGNRQKSPVICNQSDVTAKMDYRSSENHDGYSHDNRGSHSTNVYRDELSCLVDTNVFVSVNNTRKENRSVGGASYKAVQKTVMYWENSSRQNQESIQGRRQLSPRAPVNSLENTSVLFDRPQPIPSLIDRQQCFQGQTASDSKVIVSKPCGRAEDNLSDMYIRRPALARIESQMNTISRSTESFQRRRSGGKAKRRSKVVGQRKGNKRTSSFRSDPSFYYEDHFENFEDSDKENVDPHFHDKYPTDSNFPRRSKRKMEVLSTAEDEFSWTSTSTKSSSEAN